MDLQHLRASDGTGEAILAHVDAVRTIGSTVLVLDNVENWNSKCIVVTGTPAANGYIAAAGMTIMYGHMDSGDFIIDGYAPGYSDNGNTTNEIAIIKMCTAWSDLLVDMLEEHLQDNGKLKVTALDDFFRPSEVLPSPFVVSGGLIAQTAGLTASFSDLIYYIGGLRYTKTGVANRLYTASKDTYVDIGADGTLDYTEVANGAAAPALTAAHIRLAKVVTSGAAITSVVQSGLDSLNNYMRPLAPVRPENRIGGFKVGTFNVTGNGALAVTGVGFRPKMIMVFTGDPSHESGAVANISFGFSDGVNSRAVGFRSQETNDTSGRVDTGNRVIFLPGVNQGQTYLATVTSFDADGFTLNWSDVTASSNWYYVAFG